VSLRIFNALGQIIAVPLRQKGGQPLNKLRLPCDKYIAYWDGKIEGRKAPSGNYKYILDVDGQKFTGIMMVAK
jgi:hypothetical protein